MSIREYPSTIKSTNRATKALSKYAASQQANKQQQIAASQQASKPASQQANKQQQIAASSSNNVTNSTKIDQRPSSSPVGTRRYRSHR